MSGLPVYPFESRRYIGTVVQAEPSAVSINLPMAGKPSAIIHHGHRVPAGEVGELILVENDGLAIFGRILKVRLPERERLSVEPELGRQRDVHPVGEVQLLATLSLATGEVRTGIGSYPRLGNRVFSAHPDIIRWIVEYASRKSGKTLSVKFPIAKLPNAEDASVVLTPEQLFGRHCAILGATGGGKSWSLARVLEEALLYKSKIILFDATGEFYGLEGKNIRHVFLGCGQASPEDAQEVVFPHCEMNESDLFAIFRPSGQSQAPKLRDAMKSLKIAKVCPDLADDGVIIKENTDKENFIAAYQENIEQIDNPRADFDITKLIRQIECECVYPSANYGKDPSQWGAPDGSAYNWCVTLIYRIEQVVNAPEFGCVFDTSDKPSLLTQIDEFLGSEQKILRISLQHLPFAYDAREIVANAIGRHLLERARKGEFRQRPTVICLDEAHQFLNKSVGEDTLRIHLDAFGLIAKEGRKYGLTICLATQRPRDVPEDVLSQLGTLLVHRLVNDQDRRVVERASGEIDRSAAEFLPSLGPGEAILIGVDIPVPLFIKIEEPETKPDSCGPDYQAHWRRSRPRAKRPVK